MKKIACLFIILSSWVSASGLAATLNGSGSFTGSEATMSPRYFRSGTPGGACSTFSSGNFQYQTVEFTSDSSGQLTATFDPLTLGTGIFVTFQTAPFDPTDICSGYVWSFGSSQAFTQTFSVPANTSMVMVVSGVANAPGVVGGPYTYGIDGVGNPTPPPPPAPDNYSLGGLITGLRVASDLTLLNNGANPATFSQTGAFSFPGGIPVGSSYNVTIGTQPPGQTCRVANGSGVANSNVNNLEVRCVNNLYRIGGTVTGLAAGQRVRLVNNGAESLDVSANGALTFLQGVSWNGRYNVVVGTQPTAQTCTVTGGTGFNVHNNITNILVSCSGETVVDGQTLPRSGLIYAPCGVSVLYQNMNYYTAPGRENTARLAICALTNARLTYPDFFNDIVTSRHELIGGLEVQGYAADYLATSNYGMVTLVQKTTGQTIAFQVTRPQPGPNNSGINVDFLDGSIGFTSHLTPPLPDLPNGRWTMWITRGGVGTEGWGTVPAIQLGPDVPRDLGDVGDALNPNVNSQDIDWSAVQ